MNTAVLPIHSFYYVVSRQGRAAVILIVHCLNLRNHIYDAEHHSCRQKNSKPSASVKNQGRS